MDPSNNKEATSPKDANHAAEKQENPFVALVNKKIKKVSKKIQRIAALESQLANTKEKVQINEDQKKVLENKEANLQMMKEFEELRTQMLKLLGVPAPGGKSEKKGDGKKEKAKKKKETKQSAPAPANPSQTPVTSTLQQVSAPVEPPKQAEVHQPAHETKAPVSDEKKEVPTPVQQTSAPKQEDLGEEGEEEEEEEGEFTDKEALRKEWAAQKEIFVQKFKNTLKAEDENKYIAVHKVILYGPCDTLQQLKEAQGGQKLEGAFLARVGHEDEPPVRRTRGYRGRGRGSFRGGRGGRGVRRGRGGQSQQQS